jgi:flagellar motor protein MotB
MHDNTLIVPPTSEEVPGTSNVSMFLSLFLLILAFFILLVAISTVEDVKSSAVMDSLTSTFAKAQPYITDPTEYTSKDGDIRPGHQFQDQITNLFASTLQVAKVEIVSPGKFMRVSIPTETMFAKDDAELRQVVIPLFDRIVAALSGRPPGLHFDMEFVMGVDYTDKGELPTGQTLAMSRSSGVARELAGRGVPPDAISIGLREGSTDIVTVNFYVREEDDQRFQYLRTDNETDGSE